VCTSQSTCWTLIDAAARGGLREREEFVRLYSGPVRAYLAQRWRGSQFVSLLDDAVQEVFAACFCEGGPLVRADRDRGGFRAFLYGTVRNIARAMERRQLGRRDRPASDAVNLNELAVDEDNLSQVFDRAWARTIVRQAAVRQQELAVQAGEAAQRRVELLHLRFYENQPIRSIAKLWQIDAAHLHREYAKARDEFRAALNEVVREHDPDPLVAVEERVEQLILALGK
jgi:RNA polymerase sigma-70 factor (ECF subfamily)